MRDDVKYARLPGKLVIVGFGIVGQGVLPLILRHLEVNPSDISILTADERVKRSQKNMACSLFSNLSLVKIMSLFWSLVSRKAIFC